MSFREDRDVFAFASESELMTSPSDRLGDLEAMVDFKIKSTIKSKDSSLQLVDVLVTDSLQNNVVCRVRPGVFLLKFHPISSSDRSFLSLRQIDISAMCRNDKVLLLRK